jgi:hypothetical protein
LQKYFIVVKKVVKRPEPPGEGTMVLERAAAVLYNMPLSCPMK